MPAGMQSIEVVAETLQTDTFRELLETVHIGNPDVPLIEEVITALGYMFEDVGSGNGME